MKKIGIIALAMIVSAGFSSANNDFNISKIICTDKDEIEFKKEVEKTGAAYLIKKEASVHYPNCFIATYKIKTEKN